MKKQSDQPEGRLHCFLSKQTVRVMKLTTIFTLMTVFQLTASNVYSQLTKISLQVENTKISDVLKKIEDKSEFYFLYSPKLINVEDIVSINVKDEPIKNILSTIFDEDVKFEVYNKQIILSKVEILASPIHVVVQLKKTISGTVSDDNGATMPGVSVQIEGTTTGTVTDVNGKYTIELPSENAVLIFTFIGYTTQKIAVKGEATINVSMLPEAQNLDQVVVVGYGTQKKATLTGSVSNVKGADLALTPVTNVSNSLSGKLSGVFVTTGSSEPGADGSNITIRGISTYGNAAPLVVVDGVPGRSLDRIDPNIIENITVLKDASAAIYGAQAANGVILVTTKRGKEGKPEINFSYNYGIGTPTTLPRMTNSGEYVTLINEIDKYNGVPTRYSESEIQKYKDGSDPLGHPNTDWYGETIKPWSAQNLINLSISGGSENFRYFIAGMSKNQDGFYKNSPIKFNQQSFTANLDGKINKYISLRADITGRQEKTYSSPNYSRDIYLDISRSKPTDIAYWPNGLPGPGVENGANPVVETSGEMGYNNTQNYVFNSNLNLKLDAPWVKGLSLNLLAALDEGFQYNKLWRTPWNTYSWDGASLDANGGPVLTKTKWGGDPKLGQTDDKNQNLLTSALLNYKVKIAKDHSLELLAGVEKIKGNSNYLYAYRRYFISTAIDEINQGGVKEMNNGGSSSESGRLNYFGRANYTLKDRYMMEFQWRYQGSYIFSYDNRWGFFPGVSLGYIMSEENFWKNSIGKSINFFKIRASYGMTGNDLIAPYQYLSSYYTGSLNYITDGGVGAEPTLFENVIPNPNATWESATQRDLGVDLRFLDGKLGVTADIFSNSRDNILSQRNASVPATAGLSLPAENIGKAENKGFDFDISYGNKPDLNRLNYQIGFNGVYSRNKLIYWDETPGAPDYQKAEGAPIYANLYYVSLGVFKDPAAVENYPHWDGARPGDIIFQDVNDDKIIDANDKVRSDKTDVPVSTGAISVRLNYKSFDFSALMQGAFGAQRYIFGFSGEVGNYYKEFYDNRWTEANPNASGPRTYNRDNVYWATADNTAQESTMFLYSTNYVRLKSFEIGYSLPSSVISRIGVQKLRVYFSAYNLFTIAPGLPKGFDPEMTQRLGFGYPVQKVLNFGLSLGL